MLFLFLRNRHVCRQNIRLEINDLKDLGELIGLETFALDDDVCLIAADHGNAFFKALCLDEGFDIGFGFDIRRDCRDICESLLLCGFKSSFIVNDALEDLDGFISCALAFNLGSRKEVYGFVAVLTAVCIDVAAVIGIAADEIGAAGIAGKIARALISARLKAPCSRVPPRETYSS